MVFLMARVSRLLPLVMVLLSISSYTEQLTNRVPLTWNEEIDVSVVVNQSSINDRPSKNRKNQQDDNTLPLRKELLLIKPHSLGMSNQLECIHSAAALAIQYNRTLLVKKYAYEPSKHQLRPVLFESLFDLNNTNAQLNYQFLSDDSSYESAQTRCSKKIPWKPNKLRASPVEDPFGSAACIRLQCSWGYSDIVTPPESFPHTNDLFFPYHSELQTAAADVVQQMKQKVGIPDNSNFRYLSLQMRLGDRQTHPLFNCSSLLRYPEVVSKSVESGRTTVSCAVPNMKENDEAVEELSWPRFLQQLSDPNSSFPFHEQDFDAIFLATNLPNKIRDFWAPPNLFMIHDFPSICRSLLPPLPSTLSNSSSATENEAEVYSSDLPANAVELLAVEQLILARSEIYVPSFPTSITELVLRLRSHERPDKTVATLEVRNVYLNYLMKFSAF